jgi:F-box-like
LPFFYRCAGERVQHPTASIKVTMAVDGRCGLHRLSSSTFVLCVDGIATRQQVVDPMQLLPTELGIQVLEFLADDDLCRASQVSRLWHWLTETSAQLRIRRRRHLTFMRHVWSAQKQNFVVGKRLVALSSASGRTASGGRTANSFVESCGGGVLSDADDEVFCPAAMSSSSSRRPFADRQLHHVLPVNSVSASAQTTGAEAVARSSATQSTTKGSIETTSDGGNQLRQRLSGSSSMKAAIFDDDLTNARARSKGDSDRKRRLRRL